ncbi:hypothetical protein [Pseudooceanicola sp.]|uniref:hypothetical protein n=1 Tax=Pseudooceanicola sp. TaxID=1914328 RepID=UPI003512140F
MKKSLIVLVALPAVFGAVGFGAGKMLEPAPVTAAAPVETAGETTDAAATLERMATEAPAHAAGDHDDSHAGPKDGAGDDARLIPASADAPAVKPAGPHLIQEGRPQRSAQGVTTAARRARDLQAPAEPGTGMMSRGQIRDSKVIKLGQMTVPVSGAGSVSYVISELGVEVRDLDAAAHYNVAENATRLRDAILVSMHRIAGTTMLKGRTLDPKEISDSLSADLREGFGDEVGEVLFLSLYKADVPRS